MTRLERLDKKMDEHRKLLTRAQTKRDKAIAELGRAAVQIKKAQQGLARTEKLRIAARAEERKARKEAAKDKTPVVL